MSDETKRSEPVESVDVNEDEIDLLELARTIWKGRKLIIWIVCAFTLATIILSLFMTNIYTARAVIKPSSQSQSGGRLASLASQFGGLASLAGIAMPSSASSTEIVALLESNILKKEVIETHQLLPVLFKDQWDENTKSWKKPGVSLNPLAFIAKLRPAPKTVKKEPGVPGTWDGIRVLNGIVKINYDMKEDIITISVDFPDPDMAARIANYFVLTLNDHMSMEAKRIATTNREYLEQQLTQTSDPIVQQKIYNLIADKIETTMMAEVKEGFAFKVLDPPMAPDKKSKPKRAQMAVVAFMVSVFIGIFAVLFKEYIRKIKENSAGGHHA
ncbi:MAG TPA: Wzz/FepE/Etk N-terminal domain-containing protein [Smithella sp.]|jgi:uncharacterized protein involved in exopolysaccharide biosynthesis|nr:hypothetical protein [Smithella sp.]HOG11762.1 Wzz/FepE/Etk N-terminal domain-containing protein [Smithellaceae bacterium]MBP9014430.1 hypothetical protein [Smithella sp.]HOO36467.1 Wzz/FepE/Etk N-terminal domain-containing protein [Smithella sp.]HPK23292.1 Wzz/FepE/Etk N-terminal domain-containing protein [Smithella sp.]